MKKNKKNMGRRRKTRRGGSVCYGRGGGRKEKRDSAFFTDGTAPALQYGGARAVKVGR